MNKNLQKRIEITKTVLARDDGDSAYRNLLENQLAIMEKLQTLPDKEDLRISQIKVNPRGK